MAGRIKRLDYKQNDVVNWNAAADSPKSAIQDHMALESLTEV
jgi:hypothetical protein